MIIESRLEFICPKCGSNRFGTSECTEPHDKWVGYCHGYSHHNNGQPCGFTWHRQTQDAEVFHKRPIEQYQHCQCVACKDGITHSSDCAVHNEPAYPAGKCTCGKIAELLPRPFCGGTDLALYDNGVSCKNDSCGGGIDLGHFVGYDDESSEYCKSVSASVWNKRAPNNHTPTQA